MSDSVVQANADTWFKNLDVGLEKGADSRASPRTVRLSVEKSDRQSRDRFRKQRHLMEKVDDSTG